jgi:hypothetical protein
VNNIVRCSLCGKTLEYLGGLNQMFDALIYKGSAKTNRAYEQWHGNVCLKCKLVFCSSCVEVGGPTPCPRCGQPTYPAQRRWLEAIAESGATHMKYFFAMGYPQSSDENARQTELFSALNRNKNRAPVALAVYLLRTKEGRLLTVCEWPEERDNEIKASGGLWGETSIFKRWADESGAPLYEEADILGPRTHDVREIDGPSEVLSSFSTRAAYGDRIAAATAAPATGQIRSEGGTRAARERQATWLRDLSGGSRSASTSTTPARYPSHTHYPAAKNKTSRAWWLMPVFFGWLGGLVAYFALRQDYRVKAKRMLWLGIGFTIFWFLFAVVVAAAITPAAE